MLKIEHPSSIVRDREKRVGENESIRHYAYKGGAQLQILVTALPHGHMQAAMSANRPLSCHFSERDVRIVFGEAEVPMVDFHTGARPTGESESLVVIDSCAFVPNDQCPVSHQGVTKALEGGEAKFDDGTVVSVHSHHGHGHVEVFRGDEPLKAFFNSQDGVLYVCGTYADNDGAKPSRHDHGHHGHDHDHDHGHDHDHAHAH